MKMTEENHLVNKSADQTINNAIISIPFIDFVRDSTAKGSTLIIHIDNSIFKKMYDEIGTYNPNDPLEDAWTKGYLDRLKNQWWMSDGSGNEELIKALNDDLSSNARLECFLNNFKYKDIDEKFKLVMESLKISGTHILITIENKNFLTEMKKERQINRSINL